MRICFYSILGYKYEDVNDWAMSIIWSNTMQKIENKDIKKKDWCLIAQSRPRDLILIWFFCHIQEESGVHQIAKPWLQHIIVNSS